MKTAKVYLIFTLLIAQYFVAGCSPEVDETVELTVPTTEQAGVDLELGKSTPAPPPTADAPLADTTPAPIDFSATDRPFNDKGRAMSDLEWLNQIVMEHAMLQSAAADVVALPAGKKYNDPDEETAARLAIAEKQKETGLRDLSDLVKAGRLKSIPAAPAGKQYVLDQKTGQVVMADLPQ